MLWKCHAGRLPLIKVAYALDFPQSLRKNGGDGLAASTLRAVRTIGRKARVI